MADDAAVGRESGIRGIFGVTGIGPAVFVPTLGDVYGRQAGQPGDIAKKVVDDVPPVAEHVQQDAAALGFAIVP